MDLLLNIQWLKFKKMAKVIQISRVQVEIVLLIEKYKKCNINEDVVIDLELILSKIKDG